MPLLSLLRRVRSIALAAIAVLGLGLVLIPPALWHHSTNTATYEGFDPNLIHTDARGGGSNAGVIEISRASILMTAPSGSRPTMDLLSSDLDFNVTAEFTVVEQATDSTITVMIWSPRENTVYSLVFGQPRAGQISSTLTQNGAIVASQPLGTYSSGVTYRLRISMARSAKTLAVTLTAVASRTGTSQNGLSQSIHTSLTADAAPELFYHLPVAVGVEETSTGGPTSITLEDYRLEPRPSQS